MPFKEDKCNQVILNQVNINFSNYSCHNILNGIFNLFLKLKLKHRSLRLYWVKNTKISLSAKQLIKSIFTYEWAKRPTIAEITCSDWLMSNNEITIEYNLRSRFKSAKRIDDKSHQTLLTHRV